MVDIRKHYVCRFSDFVQLCRVGTSRYEGYGHVSRVASLFSLCWINFFTHTEQLNVR
jgi:hypothetical protein